MHGLLVMSLDRMVSDFFLPVVGGVEGHIYSLGVELMPAAHHRLSCIVKRFLGQLIRGR